MKKEIGSNFWMDMQEIEKNEKCSFDAIKDMPGYGITYYSSGRGAIEALIRQYGMAGETVLLPVFCCHTVFEPFLRAGCKVGYYQIRKDLTVNLEDFCLKVQWMKPQYLLVMSYFGKDTLYGMKPLLDDIKARGIQIIEDITQSLFSDCKYDKADFYVGSLRKWGAITDGGYLVSREASDVGLDLECNAELVEAKKQAIQKKHDYMELGIGEKQEFMELQAQAERMVDEDIKIYGMSDTGKQMYHSWDIGELKKRRRENYNILLRGIVPKKHIKPVLGELKGNETPLYFMVDCKKDRDAVQCWLRERDIYAPVIWPMMKGLEELLDSDGKYIYGHLLAIPCDQRYSEGDMQRIVCALEEFSDRMQQDYEG